MSLSDWHSYECLIIPADNASVVCDELHAGELLPAGSTRTDQVIDDVDQVLA